MNIGSIGAGHIGSALAVRLVSFGHAVCIANLAQILAEKGIRANAVLPGPIWTPLITSTMQPEEITTFGEQVPMKRPGQPAELAPSYVLLASDEGSYMTGAMVAVTGGAVFI